MDGIPIGLLGITRDITDRKRAEELLRESEARYRLVVENAYELILVAQDGKFVFSNPKGLELSGYSEEEVTSRPFLEFVHPDDRQTAFELYQEAMEGEGARKARVFRVIDRWGKVRWGHVGAVRIEWDGRPAVLVFGIEITELKQAEEALRESEQRFRALAEGAPFGLVLINEGRNLPIHQSEIQRTVRVRSRRYTQWQRMVQKGISGCEIPTQCDFNVD